MAVDREAKLLCLDAPNTNSRTLAYFEDTRDFVVTVAVLQKTGIVVQVSSVDKLARPKSTVVERQPEQLGRPAHATNSRPLSSHSQGSSIQHPRHGAQQRPTNDYGFHNHPMAGSSPSPVPGQPRSRENSPWQAYLNNKGGGKIHAPRISSPLRASVPLATPISMYARGGSAESHFGPAQISNLYRTVSVPISTTDPWHGSVTTEKDAYFISQPSPSCVPPPTTPRISEDSDNASQSSQASSRQTNYKDQMPKPRTLPFSPDVKRQKRVHSQPTTEQAIPTQVTKVTQATQTTHVKSPEKPIKKYRDAGTPAKEYSCTDHGANCDMSANLRKAMIDTGTNTDMSRSRVSQAATQTLPLMPSDATNLIFIDIESICDVRKQTSRLVEQFEADIEAGRHVKLYAEYYASQIDKMWENMYYSQPFK